MAMLKGEIQLNGVSVFNTEGIRKNFNPSEILSLYNSGRLLFCCASDNELKAKIENIDATQSTESILSELAKIFNVTFDVDSYIKEKLKKDVEIKNEIKTNNSLEAQKKLHDEIKNLDIVLHDYLRKHRAGLSLALIKINNLDYVTQIRKTYFKSKSATEIKRNLYNKIMMKKTLSIEEMIILRSWYGDK